MRLFIVLILLVSLLIHAPHPAFGNTNQQAAEKIADFIGERFPDADIEVEYRGGRVWLKGEAASQNQRKEIVERVFGMTGVPVTEVSDEMQVVATRTPAPPAVAAAVRAPTPQATRLGTTAGNAPIPMPNTGNQGNQRAVAGMPHNTAAPNNVVQVTQVQRAVPPPQTWTGAMLAPAPQQQQMAHGQHPAVQQPMPMAAHPYVRTSAHAQHPQAMSWQHQQAHHGPQGPLPGSFNQPHLPDYAWPSYAAYPNSAQISYPRNYSPRAWPYIGPFYPYPQVPMGWRKVTLEHNNGWWWLDFDDGTPSGPFSGLFRQPMRYTY